MEVPNDAIVTKFGTAIDLTNVMTSANCGCDRLRDGHTTIHILRFPMTSMAGHTTGKHWRVAVTLVMRLNSYSFIH